MRKFTRKIITTVLAVALFLTTFSPLVQAAEKPAMKTKPISWDLKSNKKVTLQSYWNGVGYKNYTVQVKNLKVTDAEKEGYKQVTFSIVVDYPSLTKRDVNKLVKAPAYEYVQGGGVDWFLADYQTGVDVFDGWPEKAKLDSTSYGYEKWEHGKMRSVKYKGKVIFQYPKKRWTDDVIVVYPETYEDLCLVIQGDSKQYIINERRKYYGDWDDCATVSADSKVLDKNNKKVVHAMRIQ